MFLLIELSFCACIAVNKQLKRTVKMIFFILDIYSNVDGLIAFAFSRLCKSISSKYKIGSRSLGFIHIVFDSILVLLIDP